MTGDVVYIVIGRDNDWYVIHAVESDRQSAIDYANYLADNTGYHPRHYFVYEWNVGERLPVGTIEKTEVYAATASGERPHPDAIFDDGENE